MGFLGIGNGAPPSSFGGGPNYSAISSRLQSIQQGMSGPNQVQGPGAYSAQANNYNPTDMTKIATPQFDIQREQANQQANVAGQQANESLARRYASMGMLNSGAYADQSSAMNQGLAQQKADTQRSIGADQSQTLLGLQSQEQQRGFESGQATAGRNFEGQMQNQAQNLQANEFNTQQQQQFQQNQAELGSQAALGVGSLQESQAEAQYNAELNSYTAKHSGGLLGGGGFLGLGSWFCTERGKMVPISKEEERLLKVLLWRAKKLDPEFTRFYLTEGSRLVQKAKAIDQEWIISNAEFINGILSMLSRGETDNAFTLYRSHFLWQVRKYWPDCRNHYFTQFQKEVAL